MYNLCTQQEEKKKKTIYNIRSCGCPFGIFNVRYRVKTKTKKKFAGLRNDTSYPTVTDWISTRWPCAGSTARIWISWCILRAGSPQRIRYPNLWCRPRSTVRLCLSLATDRRNRPETDQPERRPVKTAIFFFFFPHYFSAVLTWQESRPPSSNPAHMNMSGMYSCRPALKNILLHLSLLTIGTFTWTYTHGKRLDDSTKTRNVTHAYFIIYKRLFFYFF